MPLLDEVLPYLKPTIDDVSEHVLELSGDDSPVLRQFAGRLLVTYVIDRGSSFAYVHERDLKREGISRDMLHARAVANLSRLADDRGMKVHAMPSVVAVTFDGNLEATLMLVPELWQYVRQTYGEPIVVAAPARDILAIARGPEGIEELRAVIDRVWPDADHKLTRDLYTLRGDAWDLVGEA